ncbi:CDP-alcohol phosphatidyltransferase family protein, partial [Pseudanabaena sp. 'Roaring Creek']|uniref:CDP-alcohol phosphatidyltransferase family protein n=1 Tax=Pseudanabaena sp. 'Roaring Creek' TaxID=1681830 RepID=UPI0006D78157
MIAPKDIPQILIGIRFAIAPLLLLDASDHQTTWGFVVGYVIAILSDIFDGIIARRLGVSTPKLRQLDSWADICLFVSVAISTWLVYPQIIVDFRVPLLLAIAAQFTLFTINLIKFGKLPSFHTYTAKIWGLTLLIATVCLFGFVYASTLWLAIAFCLINSIEEIVMTLLLPSWHCDVLSIFHALDLRKRLI